MASAYVSPGVYIREDDKSLFVSNLADTPLGVVGLATWGPVNEATLVTSNSQLFKTFGDFSGASGTYNEAVANYPKHPMLYAADRYLRRGKRLLVVRVGDTDSGNTAALAKASASVPGESQNRNPPTANSTVPFVANPTTAPTVTIETGGNLTDGNIYNAFYTYTTANGETTAIGAASPVTATATDKQVDVTVPDPSNATIMGFNIYIAEVTSGTPLSTGAVFVSSHTTADYASAQSITSMPVDTASNVFTATARYNGTLGNRIQLHVGKGSNWTLSNPTFKITVFLQSPISTTKVVQTEVFDAVVMDSSDTTNNVLARIKTSTSQYIDLALINHQATDGSTETHIPAAPAQTAGTAGSLVAGTYQTGVSYEDAGGETTAVFDATPDPVVSTSSGSIAVVTGEAVPSAFDYVHVYISPVGGTTAQARRVATMAKPAAGWDATNETITVTTTADKQLLSLSPTTSPNIAFTGGANGDHAIGDSLADKEAVYVGTPESLVSDPTGLQIFRNAEANRVSLLAVPGVSFSGVVNEIIDVCGVSRGDCLGLIDPPSNLKPQEVIKWHNGQLGGSGDPAITLNSSYAALYWPWMKVLDSLNEQDLFLPPSGFAAEVMAFNDFQNDPWFAPAGLNRGKIAGIKKAQYQPNQGDRDALYSSGNSVNPITTFSANGVVIWGQRTLQREPTALDRVNVRRLLIQLRLVIDAAARQLVFQPNDNTLWRRFVNIVSPVLEGVRQRRGLVDFKVVMDATTNTPDVIEQNQAVGNVFLKPTKAAEMIVLNFIVTTQASTFDETVTSGTL